MILTIKIIIIIIIMITINFIAPNGEQLTKRQSRMKKKIKNLFICARQVS